MTFTDPHQPMPSSQDEGPAPKSRPRQRPVRTAAAPLPIQTRLVPNCAWPSETDALPAKRGKRR